MKKSNNAYRPAVSIISLGCAKNHVDTEIAAALLLIEGFAFTDSYEDADIFFINTCAFLKSARKEAEMEIRSVAKIKKHDPARKIIVAGCINSWDTDGAFRNSHPEVDAWVSIHSVEDIGKIVTAVWNNFPLPVPRETSWLYNCDTPRLLLNNGNFAYLKISDGCDNRCSYCKIPDIRGPLRSRPMEDIISEAKNLIKQEVKELIVIAQDTAAYGRDFDGQPHLAELLEKLDSLSGDFLIRLMYLHPASMTDALLNTMAKCKHLIPCIEMPLQHISDHILKSMRRKIGGKETRETVKRVREKLGFDIRTTFMVGYPGETEEDFEELLDFVKNTKFTRLGVFTYSLEEGVPAAEMKPLVRTQTANARMKKLMCAQAEISLAANQSLLGEVVDVILDKIQERGKAIGRLFRDAPDIDNVVLLKGLKKKNYKSGDCIKALVTQASEYELSAVLFTDTEIGK